MRKKILLTLPLLLLTGVFVLHLPFLNADPDMQLATSRDAFNAEGINTIQLRNFINQGYLSLNECHNLLKMPLFNLILYFPLEFFGSKLLVARLTVLIFFIFSILIMIKYTPLKNLLFVLFGTTLLQYHVFQYSHLIMSEMIAVSMIVISIGCLSKALNSLNRKLKWIFIASMFSSFAYYAKIQFAYVLLLVPLSLFLIRITKSEIISTKEIVIAFLMQILFLFIYLIAWYLPQQSFYNAVLDFETSEKFPSLEKIAGQVYINIRSVLLSPLTRMFILLTFISLIIGVREWFKTQDKEFKKIFIIGFTWVLLESHKIILEYLPPRYLMSFLFAIGLISSYVIAYIIFSRSSSIKKKAITLLLLVAFITINLIDYKTVNLRRQYAIKEMNDYMKKAISDPKKIVLGSWAPAVTWESKARAVPVWNNFLNYRNTLSTFHPQAIITEPDELDSNGAYKSEGIDLNAISDSTREFKIGVWTLIIYWLPDKQQ